MTSQSMRTGGGRGENSRKMRNSFIWMYYFLLIQFTFDYMDGCGDFSFDSGVGLRWVEVKGVRWGGAGGRWG